MNIVKPAGNMQFNLGNYVPESPPESPKEKGNGVLEAVCQEYLAIEIGDP